jgi:hypothetical protein
MVKRAVFVGNTLGGEWCAGGPVPRLDSATTLTKLVILPEKDAPINVDTIAIEYGWKIKNDKLYGVWDKYDVCMDVAHVELTFNQIVASGTVAYMSHFAKHLIETRPDTNITEHSLTRIFEEVMSKMKIPAYSSHFPID